MSKATYIQFRLSESDKETLQRNIERDGYDTMSQWLIDAIRTVTLHRPPVVPVVDNDAPEPLHARNSNDSGEHGTL